MAGRRRGARSGRGWDAAPPRTGASASRRSRRGQTGTTAGSSEHQVNHAEEGDLGWPEGSRPAADEDGRRAEAIPAAQSRDEAERAREICLRLLAVRPRTRAELATALARRGISGEIAELVLDRYDEVGMVDDAAFARAWVASRHHGRGLARRALANELRQRGVAGETATEALGELDEETEAATARALVERKLRTARGEPDAVFRRLVNMLARKGYPAGVAIGAVKDALAAQSAEAAEFAEQIDVDGLSEAVSERD